jgi:hypothetical protein
VVVVIHSEPSRAVIYPRTKLTPRPFDDSDFLAKVIEAVGAEAMLSAYKQLLSVDLSPRLPKYQPKVVEEDKMEVVESEHPYPHNLDKRWKLDFPGAKQIEISFDEARTDFGNDYVRFLKDGREGEWWGEEKYHGRDRQQNWPGLQGRAPLVVPASSCTVLFHTDSETNDWGFRLTARAHCVRVTEPPERPPLRHHAALVQLYAAGMRALATIIEQVPAFVRPASSVVTQLLVQAALTTPELSGSYAKKAQPLDLETNHPYDCNEDRYELVSFPGASKLLFTFDPRTASERGCDFLRVYKVPCPATQNTGHARLYTKTRNSLSSKSRSPRVQTAPPFLHNVGRVPHGVLGRVAVHRRQGWLLSQLAWARWQPDVGDPRRELRAVLAHRRLGGGLGLEGLHQGMAALPLSHLHHVDQSPVSTDDDHALKHPARSAAPTARVRQGGGHGLHEHRRGLHADPLHAAVPLRPPTAAGHAQGAVRLRAHHAARPG